MSQRHGQPQMEAEGRSFVRQVQSYLRQESPAPEAPPTQPVGAWEQATTRIENLIGHLSTLAMGKDAATVETFMADFDQVFDMIDGKGWQGAALTVPPRVSTALTIPPKVSKELIVLQPVSDTSPKEPEEEWWPAHHGELDLGDNGPAVQLDLGDLPTMQMPAVDLPVPAWLQRSNAPTEVMPALNGDRIVAPSGWISPAFLRGNGMVEF